MPRAGRGDGYLKFEPWLLRCSIGQFEQSGFFHPEQARRIASQNCDLLLVGEGSARKDVVDRMLFPRDRMVGAQHDLAGADLRHQVPESLGHEQHGVEIELVQILRGLLFPRDARIAALRRYGWSFIASLDDPDSVSRSPVD